MFLLDSGALNLHCYTRPNIENPWQTFFFLELPSLPPLLRHCTTGFPPTTPQPAGFSLFFHPLSVSVPEVCCSLPFLRWSLHCFNINCQVHLSDSHVYSSRPVQRTFLPVGTSKCFFQTTSSSSFLEQHFTLNFLIFVITPHHSPNLVSWLCQFTLYPLLHNWLPCSVHVFPPFLLYLVWLCKVTSILLSILAPTIRLMCIKQSWPQPCHTFKSSSRSAWHLPHKGAVLGVRVYPKKSLPTIWYNSRRACAEGTWIWEGGREPHKLWWQTNVLSFLLGWVSETNSNPQVLHKWKFCSSLGLVAAINLKPSNKWVPNCGNCLPKNQ